MKPAPRIVVTLGTDFHPFNRLVEWVDEWLTCNTALQAETLIQHGMSSPSRLAVNTAFLPNEELTAAMQMADIVIVHGGPASIFESRHQGRLPVCVPRDPEKGEIVDDHQQRFARRLATNGLVLLCEERAAFISTLDELLSTPELGRVEVDDRRFVNTMLELDDIVSALVPRGRARVSKHGKRRFGCR